LTTSETYDPKNSDKYHYSADKTFVQRVLWFCAGADEQLLLKCPHSDRVKMEGIGGIVLATTVLAFFSGHEAASVIFTDLQPIFQIPTALFVAFVWSLIIFNLDRFIVSSTGHGDGKETISRHELIGAIPRIILGIAIGLSLSAPLEIRIMKPEIEAQLKIERNIEFDKLDKIAVREYQEKKSRIDAERTEAFSKLKEKDNLSQTLDQKILEQRQLLDGEIQAKVGSHKPGEGPASRSIRENLQAMTDKRASDDQAFQGEKTELQNKVKEKDAELAQAIATHEKDTQANHERALGLDGISKRIQIADDIAPAIHWALMFLLLCIEITPIFIKMMLITGPYDMLTENQKYIIYAKYAIEREGSFSVDVNGAADKLAKDTFHQAETIKEHEVGKLLSEAALAKTAQEIFLEKTQKDIRENPEKFLIDTVA
jgi:Domain of unknown function (DUF4407)